MEGGKELGGPGALPKPAPLLHQAKLRPDERLGGRGAEADEDLRPYGGQLRLEPRPAGGNLGSSGSLVDAALGRPDELEVLDDVGDVDVLSRQTRFHERSVENLSGRTDEGRPLQVLLVARHFAHEHCASRWRTLAEDRLRGVLVEVAAAAGC